MAAGFKQATVNASSVPSTQSNFPAYVDLSRVGITTLAEAQSVRVYSDEAKTTELAREIVSVSEMHVKVPSLTSTTTIYVDYDGVRSDYAVTDTYGRNSVWSDYEAVFHLGSNIDSAGNKTGSVTGATTASALFGDGYDFDGVNDYFDTNFGLDDVGSSGSPFAAQIWFDFDSIGAEFTSLINSDDTTPDRFYVLLRQSTNALFVGFMNRTSGGTATLSPNTNYMLHMSYAGSGTALYYLNGSLDITLSSITNTTYSSGDIFLGNEQYNTRRYHNGLLFEFRLRRSALSSNWITTEYNNQSDEATFWGTWTDVEAGGGDNSAARRLFLLMM